MKSCSIIPQVKNKDGESVDSVLFTDLLSITKNRDLTKLIYVNSKSNTLEDEVSAQQALDNYKYSFESVDSDEYYKNEIELANDFANKTPEQNLKKIIKDTDSQLIREVAQVLLENVHKIPKVHFHVKLKEISGESELFNSNNWLGLYYPSSGKIVLNGILINSNSKQRYIKTLLHELIHAYTMSAIKYPNTNKEKAFKNKVESLYNEYKDYKMSNKYGLTNSIEFVAEIMSNIKFVNELSGAHRTLYEKFVDYVRELIGLNPTYYDEGYKKVTNIIKDFADFIKYDAKSRTYNTEDNSLNKDIQDNIVKNTKEEKYNRVEFANFYNGKNAKTAIENILKNTNNELLQKVGKNLLQNSNKIDFVKFRFTTQMDDNNPARYDGNTGLIQLNSNMSNKYSKEAWNEYIIHELVHAYTVNGLSEPTTEAEKAFNIETRDIYAVLSRSKIKDSYGFTNRYEFISEFLSNQEFRNELQFKQPSLLKKIVNAFKRLFGIEVKSDIDLLTDSMLNFINNSTPSTFDGGFRILNKRREGVVEEINTYATQRIEALGNIKAKEKFILQVHKKIKFNIGKINNKISDINKQIRDIDIDFKKNVRVIIDDYIQSREGVYDEGYKNSSLYKTAVLNNINDKAPFLAQQAIYEAEKKELAVLLSDLEVTPDITVNEANYITLASNELLAITNRVNTYDLDTTEGQKQLAEDYLFTRLVTKTHEITKLQESASLLTTQLLENISSYISTISDTYLNTSGLGDNIKIDVESILATNDDIISVGKLFEGFGDYPRLEAQLIHNITMNGKEKARLQSLETGQKIVEHMKELQSWAKKNKLTNLIGQGSIRKAYAKLVAINHLDRLDLVKPFTNQYYNEVNNKFRIAYDKTKSDVDIKNAKTWLAKNYYEKPTSGSYINNKYTYIQNNKELKDFYDFFKETMKDNYSKLPDYINLKNEEKIPSMIRNSFWEFFSMRKDNIFKSTLLALKTIMIGQGRAEFYDEAGDPRSKFELAELSADEMKLRMIGEVRSDIKSFDLGHVLFEFTSFVNDYSEMMEVLPKVRMIQNIVETKEYNHNKINGIFGTKIETISGGQSRMYDAINMYVDSRIKGKEESPKWRITGSDLYDNDGNIIGRKSYYVSDMIRSLIKYTRVLQLGFNPFSGVNNILAGLMGDFTEASGGKYFNKKQLTQAIGIYTSNVYTKGKDALRGDENTSKVALLSEYIQPLEEIGEWQDKRKLTLGSPTLIGKAVEGITSHAFIFQEAGEDFVQKITMIAYLLNKKTPEGRSYWSMISVENGQLKYENEPNFNTKEELLKARNTILDINHAIHGNYSKDNASVYDGSLLFDSALVFKKWLPYMIRNRFMAQRYNYRTGQTDEGFYRGGARGIKKSMNNLLSYFEGRFKQGQDLVFKKQEFNKQDLIALKKIGAEMLMFMIFATLSKILIPPPDEEKDKFYIPNFWEHLNISMWNNHKEFDNTEGFMAIFIKSMIDSTNRLSGEAAQMYSPSFYKDAVTKWAIWSTVTEGWDVLRETFKFAMADNIDDPNLKFKKGARKGDYRLEKEIVDMVPYYKQIDKAKVNGKKTIEELNK